MVGVTGVVGAHAEEQSRQDARGEDGTHRPDHERDHEQVGPFLGDHSEHTRSACCSATDTPILARLRSA